MPDFSAASDIKHDCSLIVLLCFSAESSVSSASLRYSNGHPGYIRTKWASSSNAAWLTPPCLAHDTLPDEVLFLRFSCCSQGMHLFVLQTALSLTIAEEACLFEHRDLHWGTMHVHRVITSCLFKRFHSLPDVTACTCSCCRLR